MTKSNTDDFLRMHELYHTLAQNERERRRKIVAWGKAVDHVISDSLASSVEPEADRRCQCDLAATGFDQSWQNHEPHECQQTDDLQQRVRDGKILWLCSYCRISDDLPVGLTGHTIYVLKYDNGYEDPKVVGVFSTYQRALDMIQDHVNNNDGRGGDYFTITTFYIDQE